MTPSFRLALQFLSRIPVAVRFEPTPEQGGWSVFSFPFVGLSSGLILVGLFRAMPEGDPGVVAALLLAVWAFTTGGLHLDGLADAADAWIGGYGDRERSLAIMKDPRSGAIAVMVVTLTLIAKFAGLQAIVESGDWPSLLLVPILGRAAIVLILVTTPYVRPQGIGVAHADHMPRRACIALLLAVALLTLLTFGGHGVVLLALLGAGLLAFRRLLIQRLGGTTGDTLGAACELVEAATIVTLALAA
jgi:adenosylcobinamide-GDP ribazoletransferase